MPDFQILPELAPRPDFEVRAQRLERAGDILAGSLAVVDAVDLLFIQHDTGSFVGGAVVAGALYGCSRLAAFMERSRALQPHDRRLHG